MRAFWVSTVVLALSLSAGDSHAFGFKDKIVLLYHSTVNKHQFNICKGLLEDLNLSEQEMLRCVSDGGYYEKLISIRLEKRLKKLASDFSKDLNIIRPDSKIIKSAVPMTSLISKTDTQTISRLSEFFKQEQIGTVLEVNSAVRYRTNEQIIKEWDDNSFSYDDRVIVYPYPGNNYFLYAVGGGDFLLTQQQIKFLETYCTEDKSYESICVGTAYFKVAPTTSYESGRIEFKEDFILLGLQFIGAEFKDISYESLVKDIETIKSFNRQP